MPDDFEDDPYLVPKKRPDDPNRAALDDPRVRDFLGKISKAEGSDYTTLVGGRQIKDLSRHPNVVGMTTSAGPSTAFGKYQITGTTDRTKLRKYAGLDYSPENQDLRAVELLRQTKALDALQQDDEAMAIRRAGREWASLPGSPLPGRKNRAAFAQSDDPYLIPKSQSSTDTAQPVESTDDPYLIAKPAAPARPVKQRPASPFAGATAGVSAQRPVSIGELRRAEDWPGRESTVPAGTDIRVMKGEQPIDRLAYQREGDLASRTPDRPTQVYSPQVGGNSMQARKRGLIEPIIDRVKEYAPGLANLDTPMGIKTDPLRGAASLGLVDLSREVSPEERQLDPEAQAKADLAYGIGRFAPAVIPYVGVGKLAAMAIPAVTRAGAIGRTAATFGGVDLVRQGIRSVQTGQPVDLTEVGISTAMGVAMGGIAGIDPSMKRQIVAFLLPQVAVDVARGTPVEQAIPNALTTLGFALTSGAEWKPTRRFDPNVLEGTKSETANQDRVTAEPATPTVDVPQAWQHRDFGKVVEAPTQGVGRGRVRVVDESGNEHVIKRAALTGRGNQIAIPVKPAVKPTGQATVSPEPLPTEAVTTPASATTASTPSERTPETDLAYAKATAEMYGGTVEPSEGGFKIKVGTTETSAPTIPETVATVRDLATKMDLQAPTKKVIQPSKPAMKGEPNAVEKAVAPETTSIVTPEGAGLGASEREIAPAPSKLPETTSVKNAATKDLRETLDLVELKGPEKKSFQQTIDNATAKGLDKQAESIADDVLKKGRMLGDEEEAGIQIRMRELENQWEDAYAKDRNDPKLQDIKERLGNLTKASKQSGTPIARALGFRRSNIDKEFKLINLVTKMEDAKGRTLTADEFNRYEKMATDYKELQAKYAAAEETIKSGQIQKEIDRVVRRGRRAETKAALDDEFAALKAQFAKAKAELPRVQAAGLASLDPEGVLTKLVVKMAQNRVRSGTVQAEALVDEIHSFIQEHLPEVTRRDVRDAISGYGLEPKGDRRSEAAIQLAEIRSQLKTLSASEDIAAGTRLSRQDKARQTTLLKQEADLQRRLNEKDFSPKQRREPPKYTRETYQLQKRIDQIKTDYERERYKATRGTAGRLIDETTKLGNVPKTIKSMGDISAVFRQGGFFALTHPVRGLAVPFKDMVKSFSDMGYRNVEAAIKNHPKFEQAKKDGVEFTGVDKDDPKLSHHEEGYLGSEHLDYVPVVKQIKDFSERTFVSFLDSQRMSMYDVMTDGLTNPGIVARTLGAEETRTRQANPEEFKRIAKAINSGTGRGNLGQRGNQIAPVLNLAMFSPRLLKSRVELLNNMLNPVAIARMPRNARAQLIQDNIKFLAATGTIMALAKASGGTVNTDPDDGDFLKIRFGNTTYDTLTGMQQPLRYIINMSRAVKADITGDETYAGQSKADLTTRFIRSKESPLAGTLNSYISGQDFQGRKFSLKREAKDLLTPLPASDVIEAFRQDGLLGAIKATPTFTGIGVNTYPESPEKATTQAEKLSRKLVKARMPDEARTDEEIDVDRKRSELRLRSRRGEDVKADVEKLGISDRQKKTILDAKGQTRLQEDVKKLSIRPPDFDALRVYKVMTRGEQDSVKKLLIKKALNVDDFDEQKKVIERLATISITVQAPRPSRPTRGDRPKRPSRAEMQQ